jgi:hypothetical protein
MSSQFDELSQRFNTLLSEYKDTYQKYGDVLNSKNNSFAQIQNSSFVGESNLGVSSTSNVSACEANCSTNKSCSGATYNNTSNNCTLMSGPGSVVNTTNSVAIVEEALFYSNRLKELNVEMTSVNEQMINLSKSSSVTIQQNRGQSQQQQQIMENNYNVLSNERFELEKMSRQLQTIEAAYEDTNIHVNANYANYIVYILVIILLTLILLRTAVSGMQYGGGHKSVNNTWILLIAVGVLSGFVFANVFLKNE